jgi:hypothetical protein
MTLVDRNLAEALRQLSPRERRGVIDHIRGIRTPESAAILRLIRAKLKRRARAKLEKQ